MNQETEVLLAAFRYGELTRSQAETDLVLAGVHISDVDRLLDRAEAQAQREHTR